MKHKHTIQTSKLIVCVKDNSCSFLKSCGNHVHNRKDPHMQWNGEDNDHANRKAKHTAHLFHHSSIYQRHSGQIRCKMRMRLLEDNAAQTQYPFTASRPMYSASQWLNQTKAKLTLLHQELPQPPACPRPHPSSSQWPPLKSRRVHHSRASPAKHFQDLARDETAQM